MSPKNEAAGGPPDTSTGRLFPNRPPDRSWYLEAHPNGQMEVRSFGPPSTGERDNLEVAHDLLLILGMFGEEWGEPRVPLGPERGVDVEAFGPKGHLQLQITRVPRDPEFWTSLSAGAPAHQQMNPAAAADEIMGVIREKAIRTPPADRPALTLVLDAQKCLLFELPPVHVAFHDGHLAEATCIGFDDILLVGGTGTVLTLLSRERPSGVWMRFR